ncbi:glycosyltransferase family 9 protein [Sphingomonas naphthae]|uniref:Glycosyltransferase family 9 protein n=1 Tax=Sphingomonas naphthae TaxID=1813468 RepID=A0ABY7TPZ4_9SPHN|nr:glycosyltransferase family 9 protein [Sphingomonas naphthae]WCT75193.1 glycosyltransferase family 9 protein [Sphingomonas naphthae]
MANDAPILIYRLGSLGDTVVALPCFHAIERAFPGRRRLVLTNVPISSKAAALEIILGPGGLIDGVIDYPVGTRSPLKLWRVARALRKTGADTLVYLAAARGLKNVRRDIAFFRLAGIKTVLCAPVTADLHDNRIDPATGEEEPEVERLARTMAPLGVVDPHAADGWDLRLTAAEKAAAATALAPLGDAPFIGINLGGKDASKDWGDANWSALLASLAPAFPGHGLVAVGAAEDSARSAAVLAEWPGPSVDLCGRLKPRESAAALGGARLFIGHDSGPLHLAAAGGTRTVGIFGNFNRPRKWHPYGQGHRVVHDMRGVAAILPEQVRAAALELIG